MVAELHDAIFVVGALDEALMLRGMRYHPVDIEATVIRAHRKISEWLVLLFNNLRISSNFSNSAYLRFET